MIRPLQFDDWQWLALTLAAPVAVWGALPFHRAAWASLKHASTTMDTLISLGVLAAFGWSLYALFLGDAGDPGMRMTFDLIPDRAGGTHEIYLEVAAATTVFVLAGRYFEARAKRRAGAALEALLEVGAKDVAVLGADGAERRVPVEELQPRRPLRRPSGREGRHRRRGRGGPLGRRRVAADRRVGPGREGAGRPRSPAPASTPAAASSCARRRSAPTPRSRRSRGSSARRRAARRRSSASRTGSPGCSCRSSSAWPPPRSGSGSAPARTPRSRSAPPSPS